MTRIMVPVALFMICIQFSLQAQVKPDPSVRQVLPAPPRTISPPPGESRPVDSSLTFRWAPVYLPGGAQAHYRLVVTPVFESQTPGEALEQNQPLFSRVLNAPSYEYGGGSPSFSLYPVAVGYTWQVQAVDTGGHPVASNLGKSEISTFKFKVIPPPVKKLIPETLICGTFRIDVEEYDKPSKSVDPQLPSVGFIDSRTFDPGAWRPYLQNPAFDMCTGRDIRWGARIVAAFTNEHIRAAVEQGRYSDSRASEYLIRILEERRDKIVARWLNAEDVPAAPIVSER